jgi:hypothetical protein
MIPGFAEAISYHLRFPEESTIFRSIASQAHPDTWMES